MNHSLSLTLREVSLSLAGGKSSAMPPVPARELGHSIAPARATVNLAAFLDYVCPYSCKFYKTWRREVLPHYSGSPLRFTFHHQVQPLRSRPRLLPTWSPRRCVAYSWHPQSTMTHEAGLAVARLGGEGAFWRFSDALYERQAEFYDEAVWDMSRRQVAAALAELADRAAGVPRADMERALALMSVGVHGPNPGTNTTQELKFAVKYARQLGVHVSPTTTLNGLVLDSSSSWGLDKWRGVLDPLLEEGSVDA